jgi:hypothetical protein
MTILFADGFDLANISGWFTKYTYQEAAGTLIVASQIPGAGSGPGIGSALFLGQSGSGASNFLTQVPNQTTLSVRFAFQPRNNSLVQTWTTNMFLMIGSGGIGGPTVASLQMRSDGFIEIRSGGGSNNMGVVLDIVGSDGAAATVPFAVGVWGDLELYWTPSSYSLYWNGVLLKTRTSVAWGFANVNTVNFRIQVGSGTGYAIDDYTISDAILGPQRITSAYPIAETVPGWVPNTGTPVSAVSDHTGLYIPDGDTTVIQPPAAILDMFQVQTVPCYGLIRAVAVNASMRPDSSAVTDNRVSLWFRGAGIPQQIGASRFLVYGLVRTYTPQLSGYTVYQQIAQNSPDTGSAFTAGEVSLSDWGLQADAGTAQRCTQFYVEVVTTLDQSIPYQCGGGGAYSL